MTDSPGDSSADPGPQEPETPPARFPPDTNGTYWFEAPGRGDREDPPGEAHHHEDSPGGYPSSGHYGPPDSPSSSPDGPSSSPGGPSSSPGGPSSSAGGPSSSAGGPTRSAGGYDISSESTSGTADS
ncbi:MAG: hypothetical protein J2P30_19580, partial [Actinobacteria bacterium]|nr:hypothetical protein [Actinomycetota bacterium]